MPRIQATPPAAPSRKAFQRKLALIWAIGTLLPLAVLATLYVLAPLPMNAATLEILSTANRFAGTVVLVHWAATGAVWVVSGLLQTARRREAGWQPVKIVRRLSA